MKRSQIDIVVHKPKRQKFQQSIKSMFLRSEPKFVEGPGIQPICRYCKKKFRAPQGMAVHMRMHERAGDIPALDENRALVSFIRPASPSYLSAPPPNDLVVQAPIKQVVKIVLPESIPVGGLMTRRFTVAEKLAIIDKYKETKEISSTCRWVKEHFRRSTFARKSLKEMIEKEEIYRSAIGVKKIKKTVRVRTGYFHKMDKKLAQ